jgi:hypothetical protein
MAIARVGPTSMTFSWDVLQQDEVAIRGPHTAVHVDSGGRPTAFDDATCQRLESRVL